jgi:flagellar basal-body rod modification protein FlgD
MEVSSIGIVNEVTKASGGNTLGKEDFMTLLLKQLSYQDPLNPMDNAEFTSQLTQFSSLEELNNINSTLADVLAFQQSMQNTAVTNLIDKTVQTEGDSFIMDGSADLAYELSGDASIVDLNIYDAAGKMVWTGKSSEQLAGLNIYAWDGKDLNGNQLPAGKYTFDIEAKDVSGETVDSLTIESGTVTSVSFEDGLTYLTLDSNRKIYLSDIKSISL